MTKSYQKPCITTIEIPERTSYACNVATGQQYGCGHTSNVIGHGICSSSSGLNVMGVGCT